MNDPQNHPAPRIAAESAEERFVQLVTEHQARLNAYILSLVGDANRAADVLQETNLVLWRRKADFQDGKPFLPWAFGVARLQVLSNLRDKRRAPSLLDADVAELVSSDVESQAENFDDIQSALKECLASLPQKRRQLIEHRYFNSKSIDQIASSTDQGSSNVRVTLMRIRRQLAECIERRMAAGGLA
ncbi:sigma-70 family RNA polymerase sigma factor [Rhodopirellula halodulae]|uniref:sigma-70 family RNA polymerase sigma factor n=1 Tax=Rhodopirellula halodulae TaxID=2894198 RepID=UPI001E29CA38|nr:sigma-70 family RNA polymerase sigma factor [Rhodopirellula sp. JC737]MCC9658896.1 sigma-70 family RNA polymerase sigma factor [Rhodopirellula sp. JC737]